MKSVVFHTNSSSKLQILGAKIAKKYSRVFRLFLLSGPLGAGKTTFIQGAAKSLGAQTLPTSPTFSLVHEYPLPKKNIMYHIDLYRIKNNGELGPLGLHDVLHDKHAILFVEWPDKFMQEFSKLPRVLISITPKIGEARDIVLQTFNS